MAPTFLAGDFILSSQVAYKLQMPWSSEVYFKAPPAAGDLIIFQFSSKKAGDKSMAQYLKRIIGEPGDEIEIQNGKVILNAKPCRYEKSMAAFMAAESALEVFTETCEKGPSRDVIFNLEKNGPQLASYPKQKVPDNEVYVLSDNRSVLDDSRTLGTLPIDQIASKASLIWMSYGSTQDFISGPNRFRWNRILTKPR